MNKIGVKVCSRGKKGVFFNKERQGKIKNKNVCKYIYIYREREREREMQIVYVFDICVLCIGISL